MSYDVVHESSALIQAGRATPVRSLDNRRCVPMAVDVSGDVAVTMFASQAAGSMQQEVHVLVAKSGAWVLVGGSCSSSASAADLLVDRPISLRMPVSGLAARQPQSSDPEVLAYSGGGGVLDDADHEDPADGRWISFAVVKVAAAVTSVEVPGRTLVVPWHGRIPVVWVGEPPEVVARSASGQDLARMRLAH